MERQKRTSGAVKAAPEVLFGFGMESESGEDLLEDLVH